MAGLVAGLVGLVMAGVAGSSCIPLHCMDNGLGSTIVTPTDASHKVGSAGWRGRRLGLGYPKITDARCHSASVLPARPHQMRRVATLTVRLQSLPVATKLLGRSMVEATAEVMVSLSAATLQV